MTSGPKTPLHELGDPDPAARPDPSTSEPDEVAEAFGVDLSAGLSSQEALRRLQEHGPNELRHAEREPVWRRFLRQFADPLVYLLLVAVVISLAAWLIEGAVGVPVDAVVILAILIANAVLGVTQENKASDAVAALSTMTAATSRVLRDGRLATVPSTDLVTGDVLVLAEGDSVGADVRLAEAHSLRIQESSLTGESEPVGKTVDGLAEAAAVGDRTNMAHKGTAVVSGTGRGVVVATGMDTEVGRIATLLEETESEDTPLQVEVRSISRTLGIAVIAIAVVVMAALILVNGAHSGGELVEVLLMGVSLAVAAVPEGLPAILSLVLALGVRAMARRNAVMKNLHSVETLGSASVICSDKTGTLTRNEMTLRTVLTASGAVTFQGTGYQPSGAVEVESGPREDAIAQTRRVIRAGASANDAQLTGDDGWQIQGDPTEAAFLVAARKLGPVGGSAEPAPRRMAEVPFNSERKMMSVLVEDGPWRVFTKGAPDVLLEHCSSEQVADRRVPLTGERRQQLLADVTRLSEQGYRTLATAGKDGEGIDPRAFGEGDESGLIWFGVVGIIDPPRTEAAEAVADAHRAGIRTVMITGDHPVTAARIAADLGVSELPRGPARGTEQGPQQNPEQAGATVSGRELDALDDAALDDVAERATVYARVSPEHKLRIVDALQRRGNVVAMTGDGVNDAPALKSADIGIAMGITGTEVTKEAGQMILADDNYATIVEAIRRGRVIVDNIRKFLRYLLSSNMGEVCTIFFGVVLAGVLGLSDPADPAAAFVPLLATQILWINLVTDSAPALAMGVDPQIDDVMVRPPRRPGDRMLDRPMWATILGTGLVMGAVTLFILDVALPGGLWSGMVHGVPVDEQLPVARTMAFCVLVFMQLLNAFNTRSATSSAFHRMFSNKWLWASVLLGVVLQVLVVEVPLLQVAFGTASLDVGHWLVVAAASLVIVVYEEAVKAVKWLVRRRLVRRS
ncbi:MAG: cation-translocating P-type ATPase [Acidipropionibacterium acidipropionici]|jgi:Ca2+-transporting ATPase|uniref:cation-translocating P-type ATPase n=1 Tax=Acidipropionibacterium acidipropionici TaxID=1748 RepID=UPI002F350E6E